MQQVSKGWPPRQPSREVRVERWEGRTFYASQCRFFIDVPLDMSGIVLGAVREAMNHGLRLVPGGMTLATDTLFRGAVLIEIQDDGREDHNIVRMGGELLSRALPEKGVRLRSELDELVRWSLDLGYEVTGCYIEYTPRESIPGAVRATTVYASIKGEDALIESA
jgi:hypothetical protein